MTDKVIQGVNSDDKVLFIFLTKRELLKLLDTNNFPKTNNDIPDNIDVVESFEKLDESNIGKYKFIICGLSNTDYSYTSVEYMIFSKYLHSGGHLIIYQKAPREDIVDRLKTNFIIYGFLNAEFWLCKSFSILLNGHSIQKTFNESDGKIYCIKGSKPNYEVGSSKILTTNSNNTPSVWKIEDDMDDDIIDSNELLEEEDLQKPNPDSLKVCGTTGKRKACKNCSCGLKEELEPTENKKQGEVVSSSCGNCYLGDAFRCSSCPYLGMPAFKPGDKIIITDQELAQS